MDGLCRGYVRVRGSSNTWKRGRMSLKKCLAMDMVALYDLDCGYLALILPIDILFITPFTRPLAHSRPPSYGPACPSTFWRVPVWVRVRIGAQFVWLTLANKPNRLVSLRDPISIPALTRPFGHGRRKLVVSLSKSPRQTQQHITTIEHVR